MSVSVAMITQVRPSRVFTALALVAPMKFGVLERTNSFRRTDLVYINRIETNAWVHTVRHIDARRDE